MSDLLFLLFELESIAYAFFGTAALFGVLAYIGKNTKADLTYEDFQIVKEDEGYRVTFKINGVERKSPAVFQNEAEANAFIQNALNSRDARKYIQSFENEFKGLINKM